MINDKDEQSGEKKRKVAKTMLFRKVQKDRELPPVKASTPGPSPSQEKPSSPSQANPPSPSLAKPPSPSLAKPPSPSQAKPPSPSPSPSPAKPKTKVAKTQLDVNLLINVQSHFGERKNERLQQVIANRQLESPVKPIEPIKSQKKVSSCPFSWTDESVKERFKHCSNCQRAIYQLDGLELEQAEALILKRENRDKFVLYGRPDGKFMTSDCPIAQRKRFQVVGLVAGVCFCIVASVAAFIIMGPPSLPTVNSSNEVTAPAGAPSDAASSESNTSSPGTHHYEAGDPMPVVTPAETPKSKPPEKTFSDQEQKGEFWQFPNGQPADDFTRSPGASSEQ